MGAIHKTPRYTKASRALKEAARGNPNATCWVHGTHVSQCPPHRDGTPSTWDAGHTIDGSTTWQVWGNITTTPPAGDWLALQCSSSNRRSGAVYGNRRRSTGYDWP